MTLNKEMSNSFVHNQNKKSISAMIEQGLLLIKCKKNVLELCININDESTQQIFTSSKSITETLEKDDTQSQLRRYNN